ncbi:hypothetical protein [Thermobifida cellulosilytica]|uniref:hypothetical protein n=1 Tax=Thermobifida cellulosilytica TaxID=144786 RepID=UPI000A609E6F|nr:hypothetical protein [Thermobifida cellulosilytica]
MSDLCRIGQDEEARRLERRALDAGALRELSAALKPYGREPDGTPARAWTWEELVGGD